jgi:hypothetical protein
MVTMRHTAIVPRLQGKKGYGLAYVKQTVLERVPEPKAIDCLTQRTSRELAGKVLEAMAEGNAHKIHLILSQQAKWSKQIAKMKRRSKRVHKWAAAIGGITQNF